MSIHQIIYTSCRRGIRGVNDGQQVFSYDASFADPDNSEVKSMFSYQLPGLGPGVSMSDELAPTMPRSFSYRRLEDGRCALALNTYLGRDYMGASGRFGNHLSHVIVGDERDFLAYPCEFYGGESLRDHMEFEEVNNPNPPGFLPEPVLERGGVVDLENVTEFLGQQDRMDVLLNMVQALLQSSAQGKRVVICDDPDAVVFWIAAIEYTLPLPMALQINFTTYDYDPALSAAQICGVLPQGTRYTSESRGQHFVFDLLAGECASFEKDTQYFDFLETALSFSYESLLDFHRFLENYHCPQVDEGLVTAYHLYALLSDGIGVLEEEKGKAALEFAQTHASPEEGVRVLQELLSRREELLDAGSGLFLQAAQYGMAIWPRLTEENREEFKALLLDRVLRSFQQESIVPEDFQEVYRQVDQLCRQQGFSVATQLMGEESREKLLSAVRDNGSLWKLGFIAQVVSAYVLDRRLPLEDLLPDGPVGSIYQGLLREVSQGDRFALIERILQAFSENGAYLVNMALNLEGMLLDFPETRETGVLWEKFEKLVETLPQREEETVYTVLEEYQRYDQLLALYERSMERAQDLSECQRIFKKQYARWSGQNLGGKIIQTYYYRLQRFEGKQAQEAIEELFQVVVRDKVDTPVGEILLRQMVRKIPYGSPGREQKQVIQKGFEYLYQLGGTVERKTMLLAMGMVIETCSKPQHLPEAMDTLRKMCRRQRIDLGDLQPEDAQDYFQWVLPIVCQSPRALGEFFDLFQMPPAVEAIFFSAGTKAYLKDIRGGCDTRVFCQFLRLVFSRGTPQVLQAVGKALGKLNKQKLAELDDAVRMEFHGDVSSLRLWERIQEETAAFNPILENLSSLSNLFKRKKDRGEL